MKVWDPLVRVGHWLLVGSVAVAWMTRHGGGRVHEWAGYTALAVVAMRLVWGFVGTRHARFAGFVRGPRATLDHAAHLLRGDAPRHIGHNPLGAWMIVALLVAAALAAGSGWLYITDRFWGVEWVEEMHETLADLLLVLAAVHVAGVVMESRRSRENLVAAMVHGNKRAAGPGDVE